MVGRPMGSADNEKYGSMAVFNSEQDNDWIPCVDTTSGQ